MGAPVLKVFAIAATMRCANGKALPAESATPGGKVTADECALVKVPDLRLGRQDRGTTLVPFGDVEAAHAAPGGPTSVSASCRTGQADIWTLTTATSTMENASACRVTQGACSACCEKGTLYECQVCHMGTCSSCLRGLQCSRCYRGVSGHKTEIGSGAEFAVQHQSWTRLRTGTVAQNKAGLRQASALHQHGGRLGSRISYNIWNPNDARQLNRRTNPTIFESQNASAAASFYCKKDFHFRSISTNIRPFLFCQGFS